jgi:hypothetical protein
MGDPAAELTGLADRLRWNRGRDPYSPLRREYARTARDLVLLGNRLVEDGQAAQVVPVVRTAVARVTSGLRYLDDSSGAVGDQLRELMALYARACAAAAPPARTLADWLVRVEFDGPGWPDVRLADFAPALGEQGLARVASQVEARAAAATSSDQWAVWDLREQLAELSGDVDRFVTVLAEHLSPKQYRRIVAALRAAGRPDDAITWARRGLVENWAAGLHGDPLRDALVELLVAGGDLDGALAVRRAGYEGRPVGSTFEALLATATQAGEAAAWRGWALAVARDRAAATPAYRRELVRLLLTAGEEDEAWRVGMAIADRLLAGDVVDLLARRQASHPAEVVDPLRALVEATVADASNKRRYPEAVARLRWLRDVYRALGDEPAFAEYVAGLRAANRIRPTFLKELTAAGL